MMTTLLEFREIIKRFYGKYDIFVRPVVRFLLALASFLLINGQVGFMQQLRNPLISVGLSVICAILPVNAIVVFAGILIVAHAYALSLEVCLITVAVLAVMYLLHFRISPKFGIFMVITPICHMLGIPYVVAIAGGLLFGIGAAIPAGCGTLLYYFLNYLTMNSTSLGTGDVVGSPTKVVSLLEGVFGNKEMFLCIAAMMVTVCVVYFIRRLAMDHSWELAIGIGTVINIVIHLLGALLPNVTTKILPLLIGSLVSAGIAFIVKFFAFSVDYTRTERVQFEDDEYYYYVKAVPKNVIAAPNKTVKRFVSRDKQTKISKKAD